MISAVFKIYLVYFYIVDNKCFCAHDLWNQRTGQNNRNETEIMCEVNGAFQRIDNCASDEYCAGPTTKEDATCGKNNLCTKKGDNGVLSFFQGTQIVGLNISLMILLSFLLACFRGEKELERDKACGTGSCGECGRSLPLIKI